MSKYRNKKTEVDGILFDSKKEAMRYMQLKNLESLGVIKCLRLQVPYVLFEKSKYGRVDKYSADFVYEQDMEIIVEDVKGIKTDVYKIKKRIMAEKYGIVIREV